VEKVIGTNRSESEVSTAFLREIWQALGGDETFLNNIQISGSGDLPSIFAVSDLAAASVGAAALAIVEFLERSTGRPAEAQVDRRLASFWFASSIKPVGWSLPATWDAIAGDYAVKDGWIKLHTNAPHHREAVLAVLDVQAEKTAVTRALRGWQADKLESAVVAEGGCAAAMRSLAAWADHPQGRCVSKEPLVWREEIGRADRNAHPVNPARPLSGIRVLDLTRILAGPVATRFLAGFGAEVLRIDPIDWSEPSLEPEVTLGKRCAHLDLRKSEGQERLLSLLSQADIIIHGYRPGALDGLGLGADAREQARPGLIDICLDAYGWTGPWAGRRGFDSLVQMSSGIADAGMRNRGTDRPTPLPVQALDHATGYIMAAAAVRGLTEKLVSGVGMRARASLARTGALLAAYQAHQAESPFKTPDSCDFSADEEATVWGPAHRMRPPVSLSTCHMSWDRPATQLGSSKPEWAYRES